MLSRSQEQIKQQIMQISKKIDLKKVDKNNEDFKDYFNFLESQKSLIAQTLQINLKSHFKNQ